MNKFLIIVFIFITSNSFSQEGETIRSFDLIINEVFGCYSFEPYYINYHYENDKFCITYSGDKQPLKKECFGKKEFITFYDSLFNFNYQTLENKYIAKKMSSASHPGKLLISINNKLVKEISYITKPDDSTSFMLMYNWLFDKALNISNNMNMELLLSTNFYNTKYPIRNIYQSIELNSKNFKPNEIIGIIDTTKNEILRNTLISSLAIYKSETILNKLGELVLSKLNEEDKLEYGYVCYPCSTLALTPFLKQDSCEQKIIYLKKFLNSKSNIIKSESAIELAKYGLNDGKYILLDNLNNNKSVINKCKLYYSLYLISDSEIEATLNKKYNKLKKTNYRKTSKSLWEMKYLTLTLELISGKGNVIEIEEFKRLLKELKI